MPASQLTRYFGMHNPKKLMERRGERVHSSSGARSRAAEAAQHACWAYQQWEAAVLMRIFSASLIDCC